MSSRWYVMGTDREQMLQEHGRRGYADWRVLLEICNGRASGRSRARRSAYGPLGTVFVSPLAHLRHISQPFPSRAGGRRAAWCFGRVCARLQTRRRWCASCRTSCAPTSRSPCTTTHSPRSSSFRHAAFLAAESRLCLGWWQSTASSSPGLRACADPRSCAQASACAVSARRFRVSEGTGTR